MTEAERYQKAKAVVFALRDLDEQARAKRIEQLQATDPEIAPSVVQMLEAAGKPDDVIEMAAGAVVNAMDACQQAALEIPGFSDLEPIGRGGMGVVYQAREAGLAGRLVAIKVIAGAHTTEAIARFNAECATLAKLSHPNIATVFQAGTSTDGQPFVVMEFIDGESVTNFADRQQLSIPNRVALLIQVCEAVVYAHLKGTLHRDLKPANVLVTKQSGTPVVKVIDFGIASALASNGASDNHRFGSPAYLGPALAERDEPDARSDVFALGVLLHELLFGLSAKEVVPTPKTTNSRSKAKPMAQLDPKRCQQIAHCRSVNPRQFRRLMVGDLGLIGARAVAADPESRYLSPADLAQDLRAFLAMKPISVRPPTQRYLIGRFARRHWVSVGAFSLFLAALVSGSLLIALEANRANKAAQEAQLAQAEAEQVVQFVTEVFKSADPNAVDPQPARPIELLRAGRDRAETQLAQQPAVLARVLHTIGEISGNLGELADAEAMLERAVELQRQAGDVPNLAGSLFALGKVQRELAKTDAAMTSLGQSLGLLESAEPMDIDAITAVRNTQANVYFSLGNYEAAEALHRKTLTMRIDSLGEDHLDTAVSRSNLAAILATVRRLGEAEDQLERALAVFHKQLPAGHPWIGRANENLAFSYAQQFRHSDAMALYETILDDKLARFGEPHVSLVPTLSNIGDVHLRLGNADAAEQTYSRAYASAQVSLSSPHPTIAWLNSKRGAAAYAQDRLPDAEQWYRKSLTEYRELFGDTHRQTALMLQRLGRTMAAGDAHSQAQAYYEQARATLIALVDEDHHWVLSVDRARMRSQMATGAQTLSAQALLERHRKNNKVRPLELLDMLILAAQTALDDEDDSAVEDLAPDFARYLANERLTAMFKFEAILTMAQIAKRLGDESAMDDHLQQATQMLASDDAGFSQLDRRQAMGLLNSLTDSPSQDES